MQQAIFVVLNWPTKIRSKPPSSMEQIIYYTLELELRKMLAQYFKSNAILSRHILPNHEHRTRIQTKQKKLLPVKQIQTIEVYVIE